ncbi:MAG: serine hydrolase [Verrucomicrobia bacterium]|nr:serine hydrolase [Verrucomicrobiota bacterium]
MKVLLATLFLAASSVLADEAPYPGREWKAVTPEGAGWSGALLRIAWAYAEELRVANVLIVQDGVIIGQFGSIDQPRPVYGIRTSLLNSLYGIAIKNKQIDTNRTLASLKIDDSPDPLTDTEKQATVNDLLQCRSGVYHPAAIEPRMMKETRPPRGSHPHGTFYFNSNWDFDVLGTIYNQTTHSDIFTDFERLIAKPLGFQDFILTRDTKYTQSKESTHPFFSYQLSARDLARFGLLYLRHGAWSGNSTIVPSAWTDLSTVTVSTPTELELNGTYGSLWWTAGLNGDLIPFINCGQTAFASFGGGGNYLLVVPEFKLVVVCQHNETDASAPEITHAQFGRLLQLAFAAKTSTPDIGLSTKGANPEVTKSLQGLLQAGIGGQVDQTMFEPETGKRFAAGLTLKRLRALYSENEGPIVRIELYKFIGRKNRNIYYFSLFRGTRALAIELVVDDQNKIAGFESVE